MAKIILSAILLTLSFPPFDFNYLMYIAFVPFFSSIKSEKNIYCILLFCMIVTFSVLYGVLCLDGVSLFNRMILFAIIFIWVLSFLFVIMLILLNLPSDQSYLGVILAGTWVSLEIISQKILNFSCFLYVTQFNVEGILKIAKFTGVHFVTFIIIFINYTIFRAIVARKYKLVVLTCTILLFFLFIGNQWNDQQQENAETVNIWVVQPNKTLQEKNLVKKNFIEQDRQFYSLFNPKLFSGQQIDYIVWPETVINRWLFRNPEYVKHMIDLAHVTQAYLIIGSPDIDEDFYEYNSAFIVSPQGEIKRYSKEKSVPLLETHLTEGARNERIQTRHGFIDIDICWESLLLERKTLSSLTFILISDLVMKKTNIPIIHSRLGIFTALETNSTVVVASYSGPSLLLENTGKIIGESPALRPYILKGKLKVSKDEVIRPWFTDYIYFLLFAFGVYLVLTGGKLPSFSNISLVNVVLSCTITVILIFASTRTLEVLNRRYLPQPEIIDNDFVPITVQSYCEDDLKSSVIKLIAYYGVQSEKYVSNDDIRTLSLTELLSRLGFQLEEVDINQSHNLQHPKIITVDGKYYVVDNKKFMELIKSNTRLGSTVLLIKPLKQSFED